MVGLNLDPVFAETIWNLFDKTNANRFLQSGMNSGECGTLHDHVVECALDYHVHPAKTTH